jgi:hypothetical protein
MKLELSGEIFEKFSNIKFFQIRQVAAELLHGGVFARAQTHTHTRARSTYLRTRQTGRQADMTKLIAVVRHFAKGRKI